MLDVSPARLSAPLAAAGAVSALSSPLSGRAGKALIARAAAMRFDVSRLKKTPQGD